MVGNHMFRMLGPCDHCRYPTINTRIQRLSITIPSCYRLPISSSKRRVQSHFKPVFQTRHQKYYKEIVLKTAWKWRFAHGCSCVIMSMNERPLGRERSMEFDFVINLSALYISLLGADYS